MMGLSRKGEYAVRGMVYLAQQPAKNMTLLSDMARAVDAPKDFLAKIMQDFSRSNIVYSARGKGGGFVLARPATKISLREVVESVEGPILMNNCLRGSGTCDRDGSCRVHRLWKKAQEQFVALLDKTTIADLAKEL